MAKSKKKKAAPDGAESAPLARFKGTLAWEKLKDEFTPEEMEYFEEEYAGLFEQFQCDVYKTEEQQIRKAITLDILMRRNLASRKRLLTSVTRMENWLERSRAAYEREREHLEEEARRLKEESLSRLEGDLTSLRAAEQSKTREFSDLEARHQKLMEALKATREQRIGQVAASRQTWLGVLRDLEDREKSDREGRMMEIMKAAGRRETERLSREHVYEDGKADRPILSADTIGDEDVLE